MKKILPLILIVISVAGAIAQGHDFRRTEFFAGYSFERANVNFGIAPSAPNVFRPRANHQGFEASGVVNVGRYVGLKGDFSGVYKSGTFVFKNVPTGFLNPATINMSQNGKSSIYTFLGGVQIKDNSLEGRIKPFAHAMVGAGHRIDNTEARPCVSVCPFSTSETGFTAAFGGGIDVRMKGRFAIRVAQFDYLPTKFTEGTDHNFRFSTGIVF